MRYAVDIDHVLLHGFGAVDRGRLQSGLTEELVRLLDRDGLPGDLADRGHMQAGRIEIVPRDDRATGRNLARSLHAGLSR